MDRGVAVPVDAGNAMNIVSCTTDKGRPMGTPSAIPLRATGHRHRSPERSDEREEHVEGPGLGVPKEVCEPRHEGRGCRPRHVLSLGLDQRRHPPVVVAQLEPDLDASHDAARRR